MPSPFSLSTYTLCIQPSLSPGPHPAVWREASLGPQLLLVWLGGEDSQGFDSPQCTLPGEALEQINYVRKSDVKIQIYLFVLIESRFVRIFYYIEKQLTVDS